MARTAVVAKRRTPRRFMVSVSRRDDHSKIQNHSPGNSYVVR